jgi:hypothetical protein
MVTALTNVSFDGSAVEFWMDTPLLAGFDPVALDMLRELLPAAGVPFDVVGLLERANAAYPAIACYTIPEFRPGFFTLDPRDLKKFGDEDDTFDYGDGEQAVVEVAGKAQGFPFAAVDSGTLIFADVGHLPSLVGLLTWEQYDRSLEDDTVLPRIVEGLGGQYFAVIVSDSRLGMQFDGDGTYTIAPGAVKRVRG